MDHIADDIRKTLTEAGFKPEVKLVLDPPWSSLWISEEGRKKMEAYGIAPPLEPTSDKKALLGQKRIVRCTHCGSTNTQMISQFGSTACKALFRCEDCLEPFDYFKCI
jgi:ring-1,2-phenylacetyl-CoA epoxidase subunit PaaD